MRETGYYITKVVPGESYRAFVPHPLPPNPPLQLGAEDDLLREEATHALGRLDGLTAALPDIGLFLYHYVRKEALLSSQIEGTQSSLSELLLFEEAGAPGVPLDDIQEVSNYAAAIQHGVARLSGGFPLSSRLIREVHGVLLSKGRGSDQSPGEFRRTQNWVGGTRPGNARHVPPPPELVPECMSDLEKFLHAERRHGPALVKAALLHAQFETIHPFLDGNGRMGRLLITLYLHAAGLLRQPALCLSLYFKSDRAKYYELLQRVREYGDWEEWMRYFLRGVRETAIQAAAAIDRSLAIFAEHRQWIRSQGRHVSSTLRVHEALQRRPIVSIPRAAKESGLTPPTVASAMATLAGLQLVREITGKRRGRFFLYQPFWEILAEGTDPLPR